MVLTLRSDFLSQAQAYRPLNDALQGQTWLLGPMSRDELKEAVAGPAKKQEVYFEKGLIEHILDDVGDEPGNLPLLEFALTQLWGLQEGRWLTHAAYDAIGRVGGALVNHAEEVWNSLDAEEQTHARRVLVQLVQQGVDKETPRRARRDELAAPAWAILQKLADARLVVTGRDAEGREVAELAHAALIHRWERLHGWLQEDHPFRRWQARIRDRVKEWQGKGRDKGLLLNGAALAEAQDWLAQRPADIEDSVQEFIRLSATRAQWMRRGYIFAALFFLLLALLALWQADVARRQRDVARARQWAAVGQDALDRLPGEQGVILGLALGVESMRLSPSLQADQLLREGLSHMAREVARMTHEKWVSAVAFSPDGKYVVSGGCHI